jgi:hypothetical protein
MIDEITVLDITTPLNSYFRKELGFKRFNCERREFVLAITEADK